MSDVIFYRDLQIPQKTPLPDFVPPPRFGKTYFADYDPQHPSQAAAADKVQGFIYDVGNVNQKSRWFWQAAEVEPGSGVYLDGGFGVGKTHLLASAYHASEHKQVAYLSFQELVYTIGFLGMARAKEELTNYELYCIDEFELDDPWLLFMVESMPIANGR